jgi:Galactose oxidase-like, Early set domain
LITPTADIDQVRHWSNATVMADGKVLVTGGSAVANTLTGVAYAAEIWDPATGQWTLGAKAEKTRLYHSIAMLLPDGSVLTGAGGAPGPVKNLNMEIYHPPYLYDASGQPAARPSLLDAPGVVQLSLNPQFAVTLGGADPISRVTLLHTGAVTHAFDSGQRFLQPGFTQNGQTLTITLPTDPNVVVPGYYMLFVFNQAGVPSVARIVQVLG